MALNPRKPILNKEGKILSSSKKQIKWSKVDSFIGNRSSDALTYHRPCPICGSLHSKTVLELSDFQFYSDSATSPKRVTVRENMCQDCFALYLNPCYSSYGFRVLFEEAGQSYGSTEGRPQEQIDWLEDRGRLKNGFSFLDVGCYDGSFLSRLPDGLRKMGVDIDGPAIERGRQRHGEQGLKFFLGDFETFEFDGPPPDTITMFHVLEHLARPVKVLEKLKKIAKKNTALVVEVPVLDQARTNDIHGFFSTMHVTHFSKESLGNCLKMAGWHVAESKMHADYNGYLVLAYPGDSIGSGAACGNASDLLSMHNYFRDWYDGLATVEAKSKFVHDSKHCLIWGGGLHTEFLYHTTSFFSGSKGVRFAIVDKDEKKHGKTWRGVEISDPCVLPEVDWSTTVLVPSSYGGHYAIIDEALSMGVPSKNIVQLYSYLKGRKVVGRIDLSSAK